MVSVQVYSVTGPANTSEFFGFEVPGGADYLEVAANQLARSNPSISITLCIGHAFDWGKLEINSKFDNLTLCRHEVQLADLGMRMVHHPSSQHGTILNWLLERHPPEFKTFIVMDPDFFLIERNGLAGCIQDLNESTVTAGVCYPSKFPKGAYWDFPVPYFQIFNSNLAWDFSPESTGSILPGERMTRVGMFNERLLKLMSKRIDLSAVIRFIEGKGTKIPSWKFWLTQLLRIPSEVTAGDPEAMRDTGHKNRVLRKQNGARVYQNVVKISHLKLKFKSETWGGNNPGLDLPGIPPSWYAARHGTLEKRNFQAQPLALRLLSLLPVRGERGGPPSQVSNIESLGLKNRQVDAAELLHRLGADLYSRDARLLGFHLGSTAKSKAMHSLGGLEGLQKCIDELSGGY